VQIKPEPSLPGLQSPSLPHAVPPPPVPPPPPPPVLLAQAEDLSAQQSP